MTESDQPGAQLPYATPTHHEGPPLTRYDVATLAVRLLGIYVLVQILPNIVSLVAGIVLSRTIPPIYRYNWMSLVTYLPAGVVLVTMAQRIGAKILPAPRADFPLPPRSASGVQLHGAAIATCGVVLFTFYGLPGFVIDLWAYYNRPGSRTPELLAQHVIEILLGLFLFFAAPAIAAFWERSRLQSSTHPDSPTG
jgi:hypothetical protein